jgi:muconolactone delta-isomerase
MKILALEKAGAAGIPANSAALLRAEAACVYALQQSGLLREIHFRADEPRAVLVLECASLNEARIALARLPLVRAKRIDFEFIPLRPYPGYARLFQRRPKRRPNPRALPRRP